jgi:hypothetical protein
MPRKSKSYELAFRECETINSALSDKLDVSCATVLTVNVEPHQVFQGQNPANEAGKFLKANPKLSDVIFAAAVIRVDGPFDPPSHGVNGERPG